MEKVQKYMSMEMGKVPIPAVLLMIVNTEMVHITAQHMYIPENLWMGKSMEQVK